MKWFFQIYSLVLALVLILFTYSSCNKDESDEIPYVYVNFTINPSSIEYGDLDIPGNFSYVTGGYNGIVLYHYTQNVFYAFDRACTHDPLDPEARVAVDDGMMVLECPVCGSRFLLNDGMRFDGPAVRNLRAYRTHYDGVNLHVTN